jgi:hypothetical protein
VITVIKPTILFPARAPTPRRRWRTVQLAPLKLWVTAPDRVSSPSAASDHQPQQTMPVQNLTGQAVATKRVMQPKLIRAML